MQAVTVARGTVSCVEACTALGVSRAAYYRAQGRILLEEPRLRAQDWPSQGLAECGVLAAHESECLAWLTPCDGV